MGSAAVKAGNGGFQSLMRSLSRHFTKELKGLFGDALEDHWYAYCAANPVNAVDPDGKTSYAETAQSCFMSGVLSGLYNGVVNMATQYKVGKSYGEQGWDFAKGFGAGFIGGLLSPLGIGGSMAGAFTQQMLTNMANGQSFTAAWHRGLMSAGIVGAAGGFAMLFGSLAARDAIAWSLLANDVDTLTDAAIALKF